MELPKRKNTRLKDYDYSQNGAYFITICTQDKKHLLGEIVGEENLDEPSVGANCVRPQLSSSEQMVENEIATLSKIYEGVAVDKFVIMPNHIHMILVIDCEGGRTQFVPTTSRIVKQFKGIITKQIGTSIWQRSYHDHIIRNENEYQEIWQYIDGNPAR